MYVEKNVMKVLLAIETLGSFTAGVLETLNYLNVPVFKNNESYNHVISSNLSIGYRSK